MKTFNKIKFFCKTKWFYCFLLCLISFGLFLIIYGPFVLNPFYTSWLNNGDLQVDFIWLKIFRQSPWTFPIGITNMASYPDYTFIGFNLIFYLPIKLFNNFIPLNFQPFGFMGAITFVLMGLFSFILIHKITKNNLFSFFSSLLFIAPPILLHRMFKHTTLQPQWLILFTFYICYSVYKNKISKTKLIILSSLLGFLSISFHFYFFPMCFLLLMTLCIYEFINSKTFRNLIYSLLPYTVIAICFIAINGGFTATKIAAGGGFGFYSSNINTFVNPIMNFSLFLKELPITSGQGEGFGYLGLGVLILFLVSLILFIITNNIKTYFKKHKKIIISALIISFCIFLFALSNTISINSKVLISIPLPQQIINALGAFRCSGRFIWINVYSIMLGTIILLWNIKVTNNSSKIKVKTFKYSVLIICCLIQYIDFSNFIIDRRNVFYTISEPTSQLKTKSFWNQLSANRNIKHCCFTFDAETWLDDGREGQDIKQKYIYSIAEYCVDNGFTINSFNYGRSSNIYRKNIEKYLNYTIPATFYISEYETIFACYDNSALNNYYIDNLYVSTDVKIDGFTPTMLKYNCPFNGNFLINGDDIDGKRFLYPSGISFNKPMILSKGNYKICVLGNNLQSSSLELKARDSLIKGEIISYSNDYIEINLNTLERLYDFVIYLKNNSDKTLTISSITLEPIVI